jgi:NADPH:quinone reductase-like Zn-dependent oxidoreductase
VRVEYAGMNPLDWKIVDGLYEGRRPHVFPLVLGVDAAGVVEKTGPDVRRFRVGDRIFGQFLHDPVGVGTYAPYTVVPESNGISRIPPTMSSAEAAAMPTAGMTALTALDAMALPPGSTLLIIGASGGVGSFAIQLARSAGLRTVAVARSSSHDRLRTLGAAEAVDPAAGPLEPRVRAVSPNGVDGLLDLVGSRPEYTQHASLVRPGGIAATTVYAADPNLPPAPGVCGLNVGLQPTSELLQRLATAIEQRHLTVPIERTVRLEDAPAAVAEGRAGKFAGKTVLRP